MYKHEVTLKIHFIYIYIKIYNCQTCTNVNSGADLTSAQSCDGINCKVVVPSTHCAGEVTGVVFSQTLLDDSLSTEITS